MTRNRLGYSTSHLAGSVWVKYETMSRIVAFFKVTAAGPLKGPWEIHPGVTINEIHIYVYVYMYICVN